MTETDALSTQAIQALTTLARQTRIRGEGTPSETIEPVDFAEIAVHVLTTVAANLGSVDALLAGRPGSWEADLVHRMVEANGGCDSGLMRWRTDPVRLVFDPEYAFSDLGIEDLYEQEHEQAVESTFDESLTDAQAVAAEELAAAIELLYEQDKAAYKAAYLAAAQQYLTENGATCGVELVASDRPGSMAQTDDTADAVDAYALEHTPLPMTGATPDWSDGTPADALRRAGLTYTARSAVVTDHSITFDELRDGSWDATCRCGWESTSHEDRDGAESAAQEHEREAEEEQ